MPRQALGLKRQALAVALLLVSASPSLARDVGLPDRAPRLALRVPDDWTLTQSNLGVEAVSPEHDSYVFAKIMRRPPDDPNAWVAAVMATLRARGVAFKDVARVAKGSEPVKSGSAKEPETKPAVLNQTEPEKAPPATPPAKAPDVSAAAPERAKPASTAPAPEVKTADTPAPEAKSPVTAPPDGQVAETMVAAAKAPEPKAPGSQALEPKTSEPKTSETKTSETKTTAAPGLERPKAVVAAPALAGKAPDVSAAAPDLAKTAPAAPPPEPIKQIVPTFALNTPIVTVMPFPRHVLSYKDTTVAGHRVDVQLVTYRLPDGSILFIVQESRPDDTRAIGIATSVRSLK